MCSVEHPILVFKKVCQLKFTFIWGHLSRTVTQFLFSSGIHSSSCIMTLRKNNLIMKNRMEKKMCTGSKIQKILGEDNIAEVAMLFETGAKELK